MINFILGGICGIGIMCLLQINRDNELQNRVNEAIEFTKKELEYSKKDCIPARMFTCEKLLKILGGDVDDE